MAVSFAKLEKICAKNPTSILFARLADEMLCRGAVKQATEVCRQGLRYRPSYGTGHMVMGRCLVAAGRLEEARQEFHKVLQLDPDNPAAFWRLGEIEREMGWEDLALEHFQRAYVLDPFNRTLAEAVGVEVPGGDSPAEDAGADVATDDGPVLTFEEAEKVASQDQDRFGREDLSDLVQELAFDKGSDVDVEGDVEAHNSGGPVPTRTLAELYVAQGLVRQAVDILERVFERDPEDEQVKVRLEKLKMLGGSHESPTGGGG